jgi:hypothetical protein
MPIETGILMSFDTPLVLRGPLRAPRQMLADQAYGGHASLHDDEMAKSLGFRAGPIEGPTHFSQFDPLLTRIWGRAWFERGCISAHYLNMVIEGEEVRAFAEMPKPGTLSTRVWAEKADGTPVLEASASVGPIHPPTALYPFSLKQKLSVITENSHWYSDAAASPWLRPIIPFEMVSVLVQSSSREAGFPMKGPAIGLFADLEVRMIDGPLFVGEDYVVRREVVALAQSRRTESCWVRSRIFDASGERQVAEMLLNSASLKNSYAGYDEALARVSRQLP